MSAAPSAAFHRDELPAALPIWREALVGLDWLANPVAYRIIAERLAGAGRPVGVPAAG